MNYQIVTISNRQPSEWYYLYPQFFESLRRFDRKPLLIQPTHWGGLSTKPKILFQAIKEKVITADKIIFTDCWDLVFAMHPDHVMDRYNAFHSPLVISCEKNCFPDDLKANFDLCVNPTAYKYLNSGFIVGETDAIFECLELMDLENLEDDHYDAEKGCNIHPNDQFEWQKIFFRQAGVIQLDHYQSLSQTLHNEKIENFEFSSFGIMNKETNSFPCVFHFNGGSKDDLKLREPILKHLNLS